MSDYFNGDFYDKTDKYSIEKYGQEMVGKTFYDLTVLDDAIMVREPDDEYNVSHENKKRKGGLGELVEERFFHYKPNSDSNPDFKEAGVELKVSPYKINNNKSISAKERLVLTMIDYNTVIGEIDFETAGYMRNNRIITAKVKEKEEAPITLKEILEACYNKDYFVSSSDLPSWVEMKGAKKKERTTADGHAYTFSEGAIPFLDYHNKPGRTMLTSEGTKNRSTHVVADPATGTIRILTPVECERLQGFDDNWTANMPDRMRRFCMGNALVVPMITRMGKYLTNIVEYE